MKEILSKNNKGRCTARLLLVSLLATLGGLSSTAAQAQADLEWVRQFGTASNDSGGSVAVDGTGNVYISGGIGGSGGSDAYLSKYDSAGNLSWNRQLGTLSSDTSGSVAVDGTGNVYISGNTYGSLGGVNAGYSDAFLAKYDSAGNLSWTRQLGSASGDYSSGVAVDAAGNAYISGYTQGSVGGANAGTFDAFLAKYDSAGNLSWTRQLGTWTFDYGYGVAVDGSGNAYISGITSGPLGGSNAGYDDAYLAKYDTAGNLSWTRQLGTDGLDYSHAVAVDAAGNPYISGATTGSLDGANAGVYDAMLAKYDSAGNLTWVRQIGTASSEISYAVAVDSSGNAYMSGYTQGSLDGVNAGSSDAFLTMYDSAGNLSWTRQLGTASDDRSYGVAVDGLGNAYISGYTYGSLDGVNAGGSDAYLAKYSVPEPSSLALLSMGGLLVARRRR